MIIIAFRLTATELSLTWYHVLHILPKVNLFVEILCAINLFVKKVISNSYNLYLIKEMNAATNISCFFQNVSNIYAHISYLGRFSNRFEGLNY